MPDSSTKAVMQSDDSVGDGDQHVDGSKVSVERCESGSCSLREARRDDYSCDLCSRSFTDTCSLKRHVYSHTDVELFDCHICQMRFLSKITFHRHMRKHYQRDLFKCDFCQKSLSRKYLLKRHMKRSCKFRQRVTPCPVDEVDNTTVSHCDRIVVCDNGLAKGKNQRIPETMTNDNGSVESFNSAIFVVRRVQRGTYSCDHCPRSFPDIYSLKSHVYSHMGVEVFDCLICKAPSVSKKAFQRHMRHHYQPKVFKCDLCQTSVSRKYLLKRHMKRSCKFRQRVTPCPVDEVDNTTVSHCDRIVVSDNGLAEGKNQRIPETRTNDNGSVESFNSAIFVVRRVKRGTYSCDLCSHSFPDIYSLKSHVYSHMGVEVFDCLICKAPFVSKKTFQRHIRTHYQPEVFKCDFCQASLSRKYLMKRHMKRCKFKQRGTPYPAADVDIHCDRVVASDKGLADSKGPKIPGKRKGSFTCNLCKRSYTIKHDLKRHIDLVHGDGKSQLLCHICGKLYSGLTKLDLHILNKHTEDQYTTCDICGTSVKRSSLHIHRRIHTGKPYQCRICHKTFTDKGGLTHHRMLIHTEEKPFQCDICSKRFLSKHVLQNHQNTHTGNRRHFECKVCGKSFGHQPNLSTHMNIHKGTRSHKCDICGMSFLLPHHLRNHLKTHDRDKKRKHHN